MKILAKKPRAFFMSDYFTRRKDYYLVAKSEEDAMEKGSVAIPTYIEECDEVFESTEVQEEAPILVLIRIASQPNPPQQVYLLSTDEIDGADAYHGYKILDDGTVSPIESTCLKCEWRLEE